MTRALASAWTPGLRRAALAGAWLLACSALTTASDAQPSAAPVEAPAAGQGAPPDASPHPLFETLSPPAWLAGRASAILVRPAARDARAEALLDASLVRAALPGLEPSRVRVATSIDVSRDALLRTAREAGHDTALGVELRLEQQRVHLRVRYVDASADPAPDHVTDARAPLDAFLARVVGPAPVLRGTGVRARTMRFDAAGLLGMEIADVDGDGRAELLVARAPHLTAYSILQDGARLRLVRRARASWPGAALRVPHARRSVAWFSQQAGRVLVSRSDYEGDYALALRGDALSFEGVESECPGGLRFADGCAHWVAGRDYFGGALQPLGRRHTRPSGTEEGEEDEGPDEEARARTPRFYARVLHSVRQASGRVLSFDALVTPHGSLVAQVAGRRASVGGQGAALAGADVDADGALDLLTSDYVREGQPDRLRWFRLGADGQLGLVWESPPARGALLHAAAGDLLDTGRPAFVAFEARADGGSRLWVVD
ncbi:MAG: hypothetical protein KC593_15570 [Myxococcales bacterium]|nr:hypothetical protein [Myxococcales bacterium]MCB9625796.1 hypothetical protein [Sandaracinaceae bacterium]